MRINPVVFGFLVLGVFLGTVWGFQGAGIWSVSGKVDREGQAVQPSAEDVNTIKGWMTLEQVSQIYHVTLEAITQQFNLPADTPATTAVKDLESDTFSVEGLREWLQTLPQPVLPIEDAEPTQVPLITPELAVEPDQPTAMPAPTEHATPEKTITGKTTFQDLLDWGVTQEAIGQVIGGDLPAPSTVVKDYATQQGKAFGELKAALQALVDKGE
jgi:hypothetical protein